MDLEYMAYQLKYDSVHGRLPLSVEVDKERRELVVGGNRRVKVFSVREVGSIAWREAGAEYICESTGVFTDRAQASQHLSASAGGRRVIISAPPKESGGEAGAVPMFVMGVNENEYNPANPMHSVVSNASCTTNCLAPLAKILHDKFGVVEALMTTVHAATANQATVDAASRGGKDWRAGRSALLNIIPASTGAAKAVGKVIPALSGKLTGLAMRVPTADVSVVDLTCKLATAVEYADVVAAVRAAGESPRMRGIVQVVDDDIVSQDVRGCTASCVFDVKAGIQLNPTFLKLVAWYDNEVGYSNRLVELAIHMAKTDLAAGGPH